MKSLSKSRFILALVPFYEKYGDLVNLISIGLALAELFLLGLRYSISALFFMVALLATIALARFFGVLRPYDSWRKHRATNSKYPPVKPVASNYEPLKAVC